MAFFAQSLCAGELDAIPGKDFFSAETLNSSVIISGVDYSSGYYGLKKKTQMLYIPLVFKHRYNEWDFGLTLSYIRMTGPGGVFSAGDGGVIPTQPQTTQLNSSGSNPALTNFGNGPGPGPGHPEADNITTNEGLGDALINLSYAVDMTLHLPFLLEVGSQLKIPLADKDKELGTGEFDWSVYADLAYNMDGFSPFITLGYKFMGDPDEVNLKNIFFTSVGLDYQLANQLHAGVIYDYKEKVLAESYALSESTLYVNWSVNQKLSLNTYVVKGFSDGSPDWASGLQFTLSF